MRRKSENRYVARNRNPKYVQLHTLTQKEEVVQNMTVRQESEKKAHTKNYKIDKEPRKKKKVQSDKKVKKSKRPKTVEKSNPVLNDFSDKLDKLLLALTDKSQYASTDSEYVEKLKELEQFLGDEAEQNVLNKLSECGIEDAAKCASSYWILCDTYYSRDWQRSIGFKYAEKALLLFRHCNQQSDGQFDKYLARTLLKSGDYKMDEDAFDDAIDYYLQCYHISDSLRGVAADFVTDVLLKCLQRMILCYSYKKEYVAAIKYGKISLVKMQKSQTTNDLISAYNLIEFKAFYACLLWLSGNECHQKEGHRYYRETMKEIEIAYGANSDKMQYWYCYFVKGLIDTKQWMEVHCALQIILAMNDNVSDENQEQMNWIFTLYTNSMNQYIDALPFGHKTAFVDKFKFGIGEIMNVLHERHIQFANEINLRSKIEQSKFCTDYKENAVLRENNNNFEEDDDLKMNFDDVSKINIAALLIAHIKLLRHIGHDFGANKILNNLVLRHDRCLNAASKYFEHYPIHKIKQNEIDSLFNLL